MNGKITYYFQRPSSTNSDLTMSSSSTPTDIKGFLNLNIHSDCKVVDKKYEMKSTNKFPFRVKEHSSTSMIFYASNDQERNDWIETIQEAIRGIHHTSPSAPVAFLHRSSTSPPAILSLTNNNVSLSPSSKRKSYRKSRSSIQLGYQTVEFPKMSGFLKKKSIEGKTFGFKNIKSRLLFY